MEIYFFIMLKKRRRIPIQMIIALMKEYRILIAFQITDKVI